MSADKKKIDIGADKQVIRGSGLIGPRDSGAPTLVDVKDGKITRIRPFDYETKYDRKDFNAWKMEARGKTFEPPMRASLGPIGHGLQEARLFQEPGTLSAEARRLGPERRGHGPGGATPRTAARAATCASPGTRRRSSSPPS